jgi:hypothetical protein
MVVTLFKVDNREIRKNRNIREVEGKKHARHRSEPAVIQRDDNDRKKQTLMIGVQKKLMIMRNKRNDKIGVQNNMMIMRNKRSDTNRDAEEVDDKEEQKKR